jgi:hypothetical protein
MNFKNGFLHFNELRKYCLILAGINYRYSFNTNRLLFNLFLIIHKSIFSVVKTKTPTSDCQLGLSFYVEGRFGLARLFYRVLFAFAKAGNQFKEQWYE